MNNEFQNTRGQGGNPMPSEPAANAAISVEAADYVDFDSVRTSRIRKILMYTGAKDRLIPQLKELVNYAAHHFGLTHYKELYGGSGALILNNDFPFNEYSYNERDEGVYSLMFALGDVRYVHSVIDQLKLSGVSESLFYEAKDALDSDENLTLVERAVYTYINIMQSFGAGRESFNSNLIRRPKEIEKYRKHIQELHSFYPFLSQVKITNDDAADLLRSTIYDCSSLLFLDPPYHPDSGVSRENCYGNHSLSVGEHKELVDLLLQTRSKVILSGYDNVDYRRLVENGWEKLFLGSIRVPVSSRGKLGDEYVWLNFEVPNNTLRADKPLVHW